MASAFGDGDAVLPVPLLTQPGRVSVRSGRSRQRLHRKQMVRKVANRVLCALNSTYLGNMKQQTTPWRQKFSNEVTTNSAVGRVQARAIQHAKDQLNVRRLFPVTG
eukprot:7739373-Pyramimonas_sp.AAC.1